MPGENSPKDTLLTGWLCTHSAPVQSNPRRAVTELLAGGSHCHSTQQAALLGWTPQHRPAALCQQHPQLLSRLPPRAEPAAELLVLLHTTQKNSTLLACLKWKQQKQELGFFAPSFPRQLTPGRRLTRWENHSVHVRERARSAT